MRLSRAAVLSPHLCQRYLTAASSNRTLDRQDETSNESRLMRVRPPRIDKPPERVFASKVSLTSLDSRQLPRCRILYWLPVESAFLRDRKRCTIQLVRINGKCARRHLASTLSNYRARCEFPTSRFICAGLG